MKSYEKQTREDITIAAKRVDGLNKSPSITTSAKRIAFISFFFIVVHVVVMVVLVVIVFVKFKNSFLFDLISRQNLTNSTGQTIATKARSRYK